MLDSLDAAAVRQWAVQTRAGLAAHRAEIDRLNVYPVPDGDTGTNLYLTYDAALDAAVREQEQRGGRVSDVATELDDVARAMLLTARGNSGVILSQLVRGFADVVRGSNATRIDAALLASACAGGAARARDAVEKPVEGTILTVADVTAAAVSAAVDAGADLHAVCEIGTQAANRALRETTTQLPVLTTAGVVDAGGAGFVLLCEALLSVVAGERTAHDPSGPLATARRREWGLSEAGPVGALPTVVLGEPGSDLDAHGPAYEVMYVLSQSTPGQIATLRATLAGLGDSLLVVGGPDLWNVHVHVDDAGAAVEAGLVAGRPEQIRITHFASQIAQGQSPALPALETAGAQTSAYPALSDTVGVVACAAGPGIAELMRGHGAVVVDSGPGSRASTGQLVDAIRAVRTPKVVLLPNDNDTLMAARSAAETAGNEGIRVKVVAARTVVQGLAALAVHDPHADFDDDVVSMTGASAATRHGGVTIAAREGLTSAGPCVPGDVLGIVDGDFAVVGDDLERVAHEVIERLVSGGGELITIVTGQGAPAGIGERLTSAFTDHRGFDIATIDGGQPHYPLLLGVE